MESTGVLGKIQVRNLRWRHREGGWGVDDGRTRKDKAYPLLQLQVTEETARALQSLGYTCYSRGVIKVKGKGELRTYFLNTDLARTGSPSAP